MAEDDVVCRYFLFSSCRDGDRCLFSHDSKRRTPDSVCRYYLQGVCLYGQYCRYDHVKVNKEGNSKPHSHNDKHSTELSRHSANRDVPCNFSKSDTNKRNSQQPVFNSLTRNTCRNEDSSTSGPNSTISNWINAPEFVPKHTRSYAETVKANTINVEPEKIPSAELCQYFMIVGEFPLDLQCPYIHGDFCELCYKACLHPNDEKQRKVHIEQCEKELEQDMELSFAVQRSTDKTCGICMDVVLEKEPISERKFGILENCSHVYCLSCIRKWRRSKENESNQHIDNAFDRVVIRACPECRIASDFVIPSIYFVDAGEKNKLITEYKKALSQKHCKYFKKGEGTCPFGGACFYLHAKSDGTKVELPLPARRRRWNQNGDLDYMDQTFLRDYLEYREENISVNLDLADFLFTSSHSDEDFSDISDAFF